MTRCLVRRTALTAGLVVLSAVAVAPAASADTATIGSDLSLPYGGGVDTTAGTTTVQVSQAGGALPFPLSSPANGIVTQWKVRSSDDAALYSLRILRPAGTAFIGSGLITAPEPVPPGTTDAVLTYPGNSLPISQGDYIALKQDGTPDDGIAQNTTGGINANVFAFRLGAAGNFADGTPVTFMNDVQHVLLLQATIRFCKVPTLVDLTEAAARAALSAAECTTAPTVTKQERRLKRVKKSFSEKKKKRIKSENAALRAKDGLVLTQGTTAATTAAPPGPAVALTVSEVVKPKKKKKKRGT